MQRCTGQIRPVKGIITLCRLCCVLREYYEIGGSISVETAYPPQPSTGFLPRLHAEVWLISALRPISTAGIIPKPRPTVLEKVGETFEARAKSNKRQLRNHAGTMWPPRPCCKGVGALATSGEITVRNVVWRIAARPEGSPHPAAVAGCPPNILAQNGLYSIVLTLQVRF